jgi:hypothetical protein
MSDTNTDESNDTDEPIDITEKAHERGGEGQLLPVEKTVDVQGEETTVEVYPATAGQRREWVRRLDSEDDQLDNETQADLFDEFLPYEPADFGGASEWHKIRPALEDALGNAIFAELFDTRSDDFAAAIEESMEEAMEDVTGNPELTETVMEE